jgi:hypothetical protein
VSTSYDVDLSVRFGLRRKTFVERIFENRVFFGSPDSSETSLIRSRCQNGHKLINFVPRETGETLSRVSPSVFLRAAIIYIKLAESE